MRDVKEAGKCERRAREIKKWRKGRYRWSDRKRNADREALESKRQGEREGKKPRRLRLDSSWAQQGAGKKEFAARATYYPEPGVEPNCKQTLPIPSG